ncbi:hypothetical protein ACH4FX_15235 [Streptomyces sp. NPDC018019]|uniref:hypothetical protein n=1 Tax=Streptomyces sp. NPDC018019 TaxID=3365030 RepID=UPI00379B14F4
MAGRQVKRRAVRRLRAALCAALPVALVSLLAGCDDPAGAQTAPPGIQRMLDQRAAAVRSRDAGAFLASVDPRAAGYRTEQRRMFANLAQVPLAAWSYELVRTDAFGLPAVAGADGRRVAAEVRLRYRITGYDTAPVTAVQYLTLTDRGGRWRISSDSDGAGSGRRSARQLWDQGPVEVVRGRYSLVLGVGRGTAALRELAGRTDAAVPAVGRAWPGKWAGRVVVEAPQSLERMAELLNTTDLSGYRGIAAVTTGAAGGAPAAPADRVVVNPEAYGELSAAGRQIVLTHEATHVATRTATTSATPLWLSEGFADWAAYRGGDRPATVTAPELAHAVAKGAPPSRLPADGDFRFSRTSRQLARAYEGGWLACRMIAETWGEQRLGAFYRAAGRGGDQGAGQAVRDQLGVAPAEFTRRWRAYVVEQLD